MEWYLPLHGGVNLSGVDPRALGALGLAAQAYGTPLSVLSGYRDPEQQASLYARDVAEHGGTPSGLVARNSRHTHGDALDIATQGMDATQRAALVRNLLDAGFVGIGEYDNHIHADLRDEMGNPWTQFSPEVQGVLSERGWGPGYSGGYFQHASAGGGDDMATPWWPSSGSAIDQAYQTLQGQLASGTPGASAPFVPSWMFPWVPSPEAPQAAAPGVAPEDAITQYYTNLLGGQASPGSFSFGGGAPALQPPPNAPVPAAADYSVVRDLIAQAQPQPREAPGESDELLHWLAGLGGALGYDNTGEIILGAATGGLSSLLGRREELRDEGFADQERMREFLLGNAQTETGLISAETQAAQNAQDVEHQNRLAQWQYANQQALSQRAEIDATDEHIIVQSVGLDGEITVDYIPIGAGQFDPDDASDPVEFAAQTMGFDPVRQPLQFSAAAAAHQAATSGVGYQIIEGLGLGEAYQEDATQRQAQSGSDFKETEFQMQFLLQLFLNQPELIASVSQAFGGPGGASAQ